MTPERAKELLPIIQAFSEGKQIEFKPVTESQWYPCIDLLFTGRGEYRIAKEKKWYRVAQLLDNTTTTADSKIEELTIQKDEWFIRWLTPRIYYEVE